MFDLPVGYKSCGKQNVGNTADHLRSRWNKYKSDAEKVTLVTGKCETKDFTKSFFTT